MNKGKLHQVLAVEKDLELTSKKLVGESIRTLGKDTLFNGRVSVMEMFDSDKSHLNTDDVHTLSTTVDENIDYVMPHVARYWDAIAQKDATNQISKADIVIDGVIIAKGVASTTLLGLETKLSNLRKMYEEIPTLPPGVEWVEDSQSRVGVFKSKPTESFKTEKDVKFKSAAKATVEHPEQVVQIPVVNNVGKITVTRTSGMYTPLKKAQKLDKIDQLIRAVKIARNVANNADIVDVKIGESLLNFINK